MKLRVDFIRVAENDVLWRWKSSFQESGNLFFGIRAIIIQCFGLSNWFSMMPSIATKLQYINFWIVLLCSAVGRYQYFGGIYCLFLQGVNRNSSSKLLDAPYEITQIHISEYHNQNFVKRLISIKFSRIYFIKYCCWVGKMNLNFDRNKRKVLKILRFPSITGRLWHSVRRGSAVGKATAYGLDERGVRVE
jgi:hypothetical protein